METMRTRSGEKSSERRGVLAAITQHWLPFLTAVVGLATAVVSLYAAQRAISQRNDAQDNSASLEAQVQELSDTGRKQAATISQLRAENEKLRGQTSGATSTGDTGSSSEPVEVFRRTGAVPVVVGSCIDLDSQEPDWGVDSGGHKDLCVSFGALGSARVNAGRSAVVDGPPTLEECERQTVLRSLTTAETVVGQNLCVQSSDKRWAYARIAAIDRSASTMAFDIVVWKLASDP
jgi:hypothetical protein